MPKATIARSLVLCHLLFVLPSINAAQNVAEVQVDIPFKKFVLTNGLTLIVHEDHKAPIVAVNLWYHVASKNEKPGKTGFAHLFEHLMFTGSEHFKGSGDQRAFFEAMERIGATDLNGTTSNDRTDFFENVPRNALDVALWIESDRMGHLLGSIDQARLDTQRGVVQNEKRQGENEPYGVTEELITKGTAPVGHPYSWTVIGSMEDLNAASLDDVKTWFTNYYGAANAVLVLAGDIDPETARSKVEHYFAEVPSGPPVARYQTWIPRIAGTRREKVSDRVPQARLYKVWNIPPYGEPDNMYLDLVADVLVSSKSSRLYKRLVYDDQVATDVSASVDPNEISGQFKIIATARPGVDLSKIERAVDEEVLRFMAEGPTPEELQRVKAGKIAGFVRGIERIGGFGGKSDILAMNETFRGSPDFFKVTLKYTREASAADLLKAAKRWLTDEVYILEVHPFPEYETAAGTVDRSKLPVPGPDPEVRFPALQRTKLSNGMKVILAERHSLPLVSFNLQVDAGYAADQFAIPGTAKLTMQMVDEGTARRTALQISDELYLLGANLSAGSALDSSGVNLSTLTATLDSALDIYADVILNPGFPEADFQRLQKQLLAEIQQEKAEPFGMALRVFPGLLYGNGHAYGNPLTGSGTEASVSRLTRADLRKFHDTWFRANNATLIIVGDTTLKEMTPKLEKLFAAWKPGEVPAKNLSHVEHQKQSAVYLIDRPGSLQSVILAGHVGLPKSDPDEIAIETMNLVLGGSFTSRVNMNLREDKHWAYGAGTVVIAARGQGPFVAYAPVQTDKTKESMIEMNKELHGILGQRPITIEELTKAQKNKTLALPGSWETLDAVRSSIGEIVRFGLPDDYYITYPGKIHALSVNDLANAAQKVVHPDQLVWVVVGDRGKIEPGLRDLGWGAIHLLDADGVRHGSDLYPLKTFYCDRCGSLVFFENSHCLKCGGALGFLPDSLDLVALEKEKENRWRRSTQEGKVRQYRVCANGVQHGICNWVVPVEETNEFCEACRLNKMIPDLSVIGNLRRWGKLEIAKRRVLYSLKHLGISTEPAGPSRGHPFRFSFLADPPDGSKIMTGHCNGLITLAIAEADDDVREKRRVALKESYRTLLGHVRHEVAHYYWQPLVGGSSRLEAFRKLFGDESVGYAEALQAYYHQGPPADWNQHYVTAYASAHPWEDWAETFAHYLHIQDTVETAAGFGLALKPRHPASQTMTTDLKELDKAYRSFDRILAAWFPLTYALNELNRGMGLPDACPFVLSDGAVNKLRFVHQVIQDPRP